MSFGRSVPILTLMESKPHKKEEKREGKEEEEEGEGDGEGEDEPIQNEIKEKEKEEEKEKEKEKEKSSREEEEEEEEERYSCDVCNNEFETKDPPPIVQCPDCGESVLSRDKIPKETIQFFRCGCNCLVLWPISELYFLGQCPRCRLIHMIGEPKKDLRYCLCHFCHHVLSYYPTETLCHQDQWPEEIFCFICQNKLVLERKKRWYFMFSVFLILLVFILLIVLDFFVFLAFIGMGASLLYLLCPFIQCHSFIVSDPPVEKLDFNGESRYESLDILNEKIGKRGQGENEFHLTIKRGRDRKILEDEACENLV